MRLEVITTLSASQKMLPRVAEEEEEEEEELWRMSMVSSPLPPSLFVESEGGGGRGGREGPFLVQQPGKLRAPGQVKKKKEKFCAVPSLPASFLSLSCWLTSHDNEERRRRRRRRRNGGRRRSGGSPRQRTPQNRAVLNAGSEGDFWL